MPVNYATPAPEALHPIAGVRLGVAEAEIRKKNRKDLTLIAHSYGALVSSKALQLGKGSDPIPDRNGRIVERTTRALHTCAAGTRVRIAAVSGSTDGPT